MTGPDAVRSGLASALVEADADDDERAVEGALRPKRLDEFVGQRVVREQLSLVLEAARRRGHAPDHILLSGPPGLGKTTLAMIVAYEMGVPLRVTSGPAIQHAGDLAAVLSSLEPNEVLFLDEIHRMARPAEEMLYVAMEDYRVDVIVGKGAGATAIPLDLPPFTIVGATTRAGMLPGPLRDRFGFTGHLDFYEPAELEEVLRRSAGLLGVRLTDSGGVEIARRSRGTPRIANRLLRRVRDWAQVRGDGVLDEAAARAALQVYAVDERGLDRLDRAVLEALCTRFGGGPVGLVDARRRGRARSPRPWRPSRSRSWCARASSGGRRAVEWPRRHVAAPRPASARRPAAVPPGRRRRRA